LIKKLIFLYTFIVTVLISCSDNRSAFKISNNNSASFDLDSIRERGKLIAVTDFTSTNYFIYKGEPMGFNYELLKSFSDHIGIDLEIITENHLERAFGMLKSGEADLLAIGLTVNSSRKKDILFTVPIDETRQVLVQRKPHNRRSLTLDPDIELQSQAILFEFRFSINQQIISFVSYGFYRISRCCPPAFKADC
jgi:membrane-bound lytic murein transglycosylase F